MILRLLTIAIITNLSVACATTKPVEQKPNDIIIWKERKDLFEIDPIKLFTSTQRDQISCKKAKEENSISGWQQYINQYPKGKCKTQALNSIATIKQQLQQLQQLASNYLKQAKSKAKQGDVNATKDFLNKANNTISGFLSNIEKARILKIAQEVPKKIGKYIVYYNATVKDTKTGLIWMRCSIGQNWNGRTCAGIATENNWKKAKKIARDKTFAGFSDWRLPTIKELNTLIYCSNAKQITYSYDNTPEYSEGYRGCGSNSRGGYQRPTIIGKAFPNTQDDAYWSSSLFVYFVSGSYRVSYFNNGKVSYLGGYRKLYVRLVRG